MFTEVDLFHDCAVKHSDVAPNQALGEHTYAAVWAALRAWLQALFTRCRGAVFPTFARIAWHCIGDQLEDGMPMMRPIFVPSDAYLRLHLLHTRSGVMRTSSIAAEELKLEPCEEYSAMKIAIKHSCSLNKDVVFCCTRHLLHHMGEALRSGRPVALDLGVGILSGRDRCLSFRFHSQYLAHWPATAAARLALQATPDRPHRQWPAATPTSKQQAGNEHQHLQQVKPQSCSVGQDGHGARISSSPPQSGSGGGINTGTCAKNRIGIVKGEAAGYQEVRRRAGGTAAAAGGPGSPGRGEYINLHPSMGSRHQGHGIEGGEQQPSQRQRCGSPGPGEDRDVRQAGRDSGPPSMRSRPAWGARVPPPRPASPGRRAAATAPNSPAPYGSSKAAMSNGTEMLSPGRDQFISDEHQHQQKQKHHCNQHYYGQQHGNLSQERPGVLPYSPKVSSDGTGAYVTKATPVGRAVALTLRTARHRPVSSTPRPQATTPKKHEHNPEHTGAERSLQCYPNGPRPLSAPRCRQQGNEPDDPVMAADNSTRGAHVVSPRVDGARATPRPPWGAGRGACARTNGGGSPGATRPRSAPRFRPVASSSAAMAEATVMPVAGEAITLGEPRHCSQAAWPAAGGGSNSGGGAAAGGQLWSPDNNLKMVSAAVRGGTGACGVRVRRPFGSTGCSSPGRAAPCSGSGSEQLRQQHPPSQRHLPARSQAPQQTNGGTDHPQCPMSSCANAEMDDHVGSDQQKLPHHRLQEGQQQVPQKQNPKGRTGARKPLFMSPQKDGPLKRTPLAEETAHMTVSRGRLEMKPQSQHPGGGDSSRKQPSAVAMIVDIPASCDEPDNSPQLRRDQSARPSRSPEHAKSVAAAATPATAAATSTSLRRTAILRSLSPRLETQQYNLRYGTHGSGNYIAVARDHSCCDSRINRNPADATIAGSQGPSLLAAIGIADQPEAAAASAAMGSLYANVSRMLARSDPSDGSLVALSSVAAAAASTWHRDASLTNSTRAAAALGSGPLVAKATLPSQETALIVPRATKIPNPEETTQGGVVGKAAGLLQGVAGCPGLAARRQRHGRDVQIGRRLGEEGADISSSCCGLHSTGSLHTSVEDGPKDSRNGGGATVVAVPGFGSHRSPMPGATAKALAITPAVQAVLSRNHRAAADWIYEAVDSSCTNSRNGSNNSSGSSLMQVVHLQHARRFNLVAGIQHAPAFTTAPVIITEADLPQPAWRTFPSRRDGGNVDNGGHAGSTRDGGDQLSIGCAHVLASETTNATEGRAEVESGLEPGPEGVVACSVASSGEICWSARSGHGQDSCVVVARGGGGGTLPHRRACGGAFDATEPAEYFCRDAIDEANSAIHGRCRRGGPICTSSDRDMEAQHNRSSGIASDDDNGSRDDNGVAEFDQEDDRKTSRRYPNEDSSGKCQFSNGGGDYDAGRCRGNGTGPTAPSPETHRNGLGYGGAWLGTIAATGGGVTTFISTDSSMPLMGSRGDGGEKDDKEEEEEEVRVEGSQHSSRSFSYSDRHIEEGAYNCGHVESPSSSSSSEDNYRCGYSIYGCLGHRRNDISRAGESERKQLSALVASATRGRGRDGSACGKNGSEL